MTRRAQHGLTLVEVLIAAVIITIVAFALMKTLGGVVQLSHSTRKQIQAADLVKAISAELQSLPFANVYALDTDNKNPAYAVCPATTSFSTFKPDNYLMKWDVSPSSPTFYRLEQLVKDNGYKGFRTTVTYLKRYRANEWRLESIIQWMDVNHRSSNTTPDGCDDDDTSLCWRDLAQLPGEPAGQYYAPQDPPQSRIKQVDTELIRADGQVAARHGFLMTEARLTGRETASGGSPVHMKVPNPMNWVDIFQVTPVTKPHLEYKSILCFGKARYWGVEYLGYVNRRVDNNTAMDVTVNDHIWLTNGQWGGNDGPTVLAGADPLAHFHLRLQTEPVGELEVYLVGNGAVDPRLKPNPNRPLTAPVTPHAVIPLANLRTPGQNSNDLLITRDEPNFKNVYDILATCANGGYIETFLRKRLNGEFSPWFHRSLCVDLVPPFVVDLPPTGSFTAGGSPVIQIGVLDDPAYCYWKRINPFQSAMKINYIPPPPVLPAAGIPLPRPDFTWVNAPGDYSLTYGGHDPTIPAFFERGPIESFPTSGYRSTQTFRLVDNDLLPSELAPGAYTFVFEFSDSAPYYSSHTWTNTFLPYAGDTSTPTIHVDDDLGAPYPWTTPGKTIYKQSGTVYKNQVYDLRAVSIVDPESGIKWNTFIVEDCDPITGACTPILKYGEASNPGNLKYGDYFDFGLINATTRLSHRVTYNFPNAGDRIIRIKAKNWVNLEGTYDEWQVTVNP